MMRWVLIVFSVLAFVSCKMADFSSEEFKVWQSSVDKDSYTGIDVRSTKEVQKNPAPGSLNIPRAKLEDRMQELDKSKQIIVFCESGLRSSLAKKKLVKNGFTNVVNIGSWREWNSLYKDKK